MSISSCARAFRQNRQAWSQTQKSAAALAAALLGPTTVTFSVSRPFLQVSVHSSELEIGFWMIWPPLTANVLSSDGSILVDLIVSFGCLTSGNTVRTCENPQNPEEQTDRFRCHMTQSIPPRTINS